jgi:hypothetical protein
MVVRRRGVSTPFHSTPWTAGVQPVIRLVCDGNVTAMEDRCCVKLTLCARKASMFGVSETDRFSEGPI